YQLNPGHTELASEYGRLALSLGKVQLAEQLLNQARRDKRRQDWRVLSALGTVNAKRGDHKKAQSFYLAALRQKPGATSVYNNLALSYALDGRAGDSEALLKKAITKGHNTPRVRQNLALVLGLQTKFGEAKQVAQADLSGKTVASNVGFLKSMVKKTKVADASKPARKTKRKTGSITTAALPSAKKAASASSKTARKAASRPVKTATAPKPAVQKTRIARKAHPPKNIPVPARKPGKPVRPVKVASAQSAAITRASKPAETLPWHKKPAAPKSTRSARLASTAPGKSGARNLPRTGVPTWNISVSRGSPAKPAPAKSSADIDKESPDFAFPDGE
ncbi:MAG: hypothetical protein ACE5FM_07245, partial [Methyloligellaceae bacterium]